MGAVEMLQAVSDITTLTGVYSKVDQDIFEVIEHLSLVSSLNPTNLQISDLQEPLDVRGFTYAPLKFSPAALIKKLTKLKIPAENSYLFELYSLLRAEALAKLGLTALRGRSADELIEPNLAVFGRPNTELLPAALEILNKSLDPVDQTEQRYSYADCAQIFIRYLRQAYKINRWQILPAAGGRMSVCGALQVIRVPQGSIKRLSLRNIQSLIAHELDCHILRAENGRRQPLRILEKGAAGYISTEEGLAMYAESLVQEGKLTNQRYAAGLFLAVNRVIDQVSHHEIFAELLSFSFSARLANQILAAVFRGGAFIKDHVYFQGFFEVSAAIDAGLDPMDLMLGKVNIQQAKNLTGMHGELGLVSKQDLLKPLSIADPARFRKLTERPLLKLL